MVNNCPTAAGNSTKADGGIAVVTVIRGDEGDDFMNYGGILNSPQHLLILT